MQWPNPEKVTRQELLHLIDLHNHALELVRIYSAMKSELLNRLLAGADHDDVSADELIMKLFLGMLACLIELPQ